MPHPDPESFMGQHSRKMLAAAQSIISFERIGVEPKDEKPCTIYRCYTDADGQPQIVEIGKCFVGDIDLDVKEPEPAPQQNRVWVAVDFPGLGTGQF